MIPAAPRPSTSCSLVLIVFSVAVAGVLAEAFLPRLRWRYGTVTFRPWRVSGTHRGHRGVGRCRSGHAAVLGAIAVDRATLFSARHRTTGHDHGSRLHGRAACPGESATPEHPRCGAAPRTHSFTSQASAVPGN